MAHISGSLYRLSGRFNPLVIENVYLITRGIHQNPPGCSSSAGGPSTPLRPPDGESKEEKSKKKPPQKRWLHYNQSSDSNGFSAVSMRERNKTVTSYYNQTAIDRAADKNSVRLTPATIMYSGAGKSTTQNNIMVSSKCYFYQLMQCGQNVFVFYLQRSAQYLHRELPIRIAHRIAAIRNLPFIVGCNPTILAVHELYIRAFHILNDFPQILTPDDEERYSQVLRELLEDHKDVVSQLAQGFKECRKHIHVSSTPWPKQSTTRK